LSENFNSQRTCWCIYKAIVGWSAQNLLGLVAGKSPINQSKGLPKLQNTLYRIVKNTLYSIVKNTIYRIVNNTVRRIVNNTLYRIVNNTFYRIVNNTLYRIDDNNENIRI